MPKPLRRRCDARLPVRDIVRDRAIRAGELSKYLRRTRCKKWALRGSKRCRLHGGLSTGPKTSEGKARTIAAMVEGRRRLLEKLKAEGKPVPWGRKRGGVSRSAAERQLARASKEHARAQRDLKKFLSRKFRRQRRQARGGQGMRPLCRETTLQWILYIWTSTAKPRHLPNRVNVRNGQPGMNCMFTHTHSLGPGLHVRKMLATFCFATLLTGGASADESYWNCDLSGQTIRCSSYRLSDTASHRLSDTYEGFLEQKVKLSLDLSEPAPACTIQQFESSGAGAIDPPHITKMEMLIRYTCDIPPDLTKSTIELRRAVPRGTISIVNEGNSSFMHLVVTNTMMANGYVGIPKAQHDLFPGERSLSQAL
jgi:hypothetical protein